MRYPLGMMASPLRLSIIGLGLGSMFVRLLKDYPQAKITSLVDLDEKRLAAAEAELGYPVARYADYPQMLRETKPDLVFVCLPNVLHKQVTIDCLEAGCGVLCEKPMAMTVAECQEMKAVAERTGSWLGIDLSYRFDPTSLACKALVESGALGEIYHGYTTWRRRDGFPGFGGWFGQKKLSGGGPLIDLGVHRIDLAMWLMGDVKPVTVSGTAHAKLGVPRPQAAGKAFDVEDLAAGIIRFDGGQSLVFEASWAGHEEDAEPMATRLMGTQGGLTQRNTGEGYDARAFYTTAVEGHATVAEIFPKAEAKHAVQYAVDALAAGKPFMASADDGIRIQQVLDGLYESATTGREVTL